MTNFQERRHIYPMLVWCWPSIGSACHWLHSGSAVGILCIIAWRGNDMETQFWIWVSDVLLVGSRHPGIVCIPASRGVTWGHGTYRWHHTVTVALFRGVMPWIWHAFPAIFSLAHTRTRTCAEPVPAILDFIIIPPTLWWFGNGEKVAD